MESGPNVIFNVCSQSLSHFLFLS